MKKNQDVISFNANKKWLSIPKEFRSEIERNVFCGRCMDVVQIVDYIVTESNGLVALKGKCKTCGNNVARVLD